MKHAQKRLCWLILLWVTIACPRPSLAGEGPLPENLARQAAATATSEHNQHYLARFAIDGRVPQAGSHADLDAAWCVLKAQSGDQAEFTLTWPKAVEAAEIVYFGRTAWMLSECWKDYEVYVQEGDAAAGPTKLVAKGRFEMLHGPQRIALPRVRTQKITLKFLNSHGGLNPGAAEIMVFGQPLSDAQWKTLARKVAGIETPRLDDVDRGQLRAAIERLAALHPGRYTQAAAHLARLDQLADDAPELVSLQRQALLFDVDKLLAIKRHEINASHVYTYHYEGQQNGGGLYVAAVDPADPGRAALQELVASPDGQILDCDLSYDGRRALFSWRRGLDQGYHVWTVNTDGTDLRQLTDGEWHDYNACWLPDGGIAFLSTRNPQFAYCWHAPVGVLYRMDADGGNPRRLSSNYLNDFTPAVLDDGRIIYTRWEYVDRRPSPSRACGRSIRTEAG